MTAAWQRSIDAVFRFPPSLSRRDTFVQSVCVCVCVCVCVGGGGEEGGRGGMGCWVQSHFPNQLLVMEPKVIWNQGFSLQ